MDNIEPHQHVWAVNGIHYGNEIPCTVGGCPAMFELTDEE
jgi:hypothetical protein